MAHSRSDDPRTRATPEGFLPSERLRYDAVAAPLSMANDWLHR